MTLPTDIDSKQQTAAAWFRDFRDQLCAALESIEAEAPGRTPDILREVLRDLNA